MTLTKIDTVTTPGPSAVVISTSSTFGVYTASGQCTHGAREHHFSTFSKARGLEEVHVRIRMALSEEKPSPYRVRIPFLQSHENPVVLDFIIAMGYGLWVLTTTPLSIFQSRHFAPPRPAIPHPLFPGTQNTGHRTQNTEHRTHCPLFPESNTTSLDRLSHLDTHRSSGTRSLSTPAGSALPQSQAAYPAEHGGNHVRRPRRSHRDGHQRV